ncbi:MAG: glycosyl hydrolase 115 family protein [Prevotella sp.]|nr:glycosyl hydrolase 115 family protein [Prevotella sp.]
MKKLSLIITTVLLSVIVHATESFVLFQPSADALPLQGVTIGFSAQENVCVQRAAASLQADFERVTGIRPATSDEPTILIGTVGVNKQIDQWVKQGVLRDLKGKTEKYILKTIGNQLVIAGSDKRGTVFGIYELSQQIGVSPWYWWADVPVVKHTDLYIKKGEYTDGEPQVRYRGLFLNDEAPCLTTWVKNTFGTNYGDHRFYEKVFELILRLKGNFLWPAMWGWAFYADDPENLKTADAMGVIMGTSHHEPMARNHQEYARHRKEWGPWNYQKNKENLDRFFREGIERMKGTDDIVTIGMRGDGDEAMSEDADTKLLQTIVENQRKIIKQVTGRPAKETPQVWALYKEVLDYYDKGMRVPDDVLILLCDDNWGNVRRVPNAKERQHPGGWGLYYHVDYVGAPRNSKWLNVTPSQNMWEQLTLAADYGLDRMWILNVGDLKPMEYPITLFMDMAWNPRSVSRDVVATHTEPFCRQQFGDEQAAEAARILNLCCKYAGRTTAEMMDARTYNVATGEWRRVADDYMRLEAEALRQYLTLKPEYRDAYQQLILFPVQAMSNLYQMYYAVAMNRYLAQKNLPEANEWAQRAREAFRRDSLLCASYNHDIAGGKWNGMMIQKHIGYRSWNDDFPADRLPEIKTVPDGSPVGKYTFTMNNGFVAMEAEHYYDATPAKNAQWTVLPFVGRTLSGMTLMPYTEPVNGASLSYRFVVSPECVATQSQTTVKVHVVVKSTLDYLNKGGLTYSVVLDGSEPQVVNFNHNLNEAKENIYSIFYPTVARRVVESVVTLPFDVSKKEHTLTLSPNDPAIVFEKIVVDAGGYQPEFLFGEESEKKRD